MSAVAKVWYNCIKNRSKSWDDCPSRYKREVQQMFKQDVREGRMTPREYEELLGVPYKE